MLFSKTNLELHNFSNIFRIPVYVGNYGSLKFWHVSKFKQGVIAVVFTLTSM